MEAGAKLTKTAGHAALADYVNARMNLKWTSKEGKSRLESLVKNYKKTQKSYGHKWCEVLFDREGIDVGAHN